MAYLKMTSATIVDGAGVTHFPAGWWLTVYATDLDYLGETVAHRESDVSVYFLLYRVSRAIEERGPLRLSQVRTIVRDARRDFTSGGPDDDFLPWVVAQLDGRPHEASALITR